MKAHVKTAKPDVAFSLNLLLNFYYFMMGQTKLSEDTFYEKSPSLIAS